MRVERKVLEVGVGGGGGGPRHGRTPEPACHVQAVHVNVVCRRAWGAIVRRAKGAAAGAAGLGSGQRSEGEGGSKPGTEPPCSCKRRRQRSPRGSCTLATLSALTIQTPVHLAVADGRLAVHVQLEQPVGLVGGVEQDRELNAVPLAGDKLEGTTLEGDTCAGLCTGLGWPGAGPAGCCGARARDPDSHARQSQNRDACRPRGRGSWPCRPALCGPGATTCPRHRPAVCMHR